jgi:ligand-binding SRPBCC domain-containing protein
MKTHTLETETTIDSPLAKVFPFFESPENLARITPPSVGFRILTPLPIRMQTGAVIDYTVRVFGFRVHWRTLITDYTPGRQFVDQQIKGPYALWHHTHTFEERDGRTVMRDRVVYALPFGLLGRMVHRLMVRRQVERIFKYREQVIQKIFSSASAPVNLKRMAE